MHRRSCAIVLVGQSSLLREGLRHILGAPGSGFQIVASAATVDDLDWAPMEQHPTLLLIIDAGGEPLALAREIAMFKNRQPGGRIVVLADHVVPGSVLAAFHAGANAWYHKSVASDAFVKALELVTLGETILPPELLAHFHGVNTVVHAPEASPGDASLTPQKPDAAPERQLPPDFDPKLSCREEYILQYIGEGYPNKIIARKMGIAEGTVKVHVKAILRKIRVGNRTQAAIWLKDNPMSAAARGPARIGSRTPVCATNGATKNGSVFMYPSPN